MVRYWPFLNLIWKIENKNTWRALPNQSLKLTEVAVDDFAARQKIFKGKAMPAARIVYRELAARRRSLAPVR